MRVPPSQSATSSEAVASACFAIFQVQRPGNACEPRADGENFHRVGGANQRMRKRQMGLRALLHRSGNVDQNNDTPLPQPALALTQAKNLAGVTHGVAEHAAGVRARSATG